MKEKTRPLNAKPATLPLQKRVPSANIPLDAKSPAQLLEDLMGILSNRKELLEKIIKKFPRAHDGNKTFQQYRKQTKQFLAVLLEELSAYGDGLAGPDPNNAYNDCWKAFLKKWDTINHHRLIPFWKELEDILRDVYKTLRGLSATLPESFNTILAQQLAVLEPPGKNE